MRRMLHPHWTHPRPWERPHPPLRMVTRTIPPQDLIPTPLPPARKECTYIGDVCSIHGKGAKLKWRLAKTKSLGPNGILRPDREYYRVCDVGISNIKLVQPSLPQSWTKKTPIRKTEDPYGHL